ncbi:DgyrCDS3355 [Dimorphilus gyrociliatus]|uniref:DgyrCDS3355 n=1 Tax=Dimorphilus gyrociliatus TaxID=2664684 RepID=A0A7I8VE26_9ANNE|nr:DgyrCDS3355 [Dimorphilus gyrociliatus]
MTDIDVCVGNNTIVDAEVYQLWLKGLTVNEACTVQQKKGVVQKFDATSEMLRAEIHNHYRTFNMLERYLKSPQKLPEQLVFQLDSETQKLLVERYYALDSIVIREFLGKKLSSKNRNQLDDVSEKTRIALKSCRRQFDNLKRVFKTVEELMGSLVENIKTHFLISNSLARQYAAIVFITNNRFETGKKRLLHITFDDFAFCANEMMTNWSYSSEDCKNHEDMDVDLDQEFLHELREIKGMMNSLDEHKSIVCKEVKDKITPDAYSELDCNFKSISKACIHIGYNLNHSKELKDFFNDVIEKIVDQFRGFRWSIADTNTFFWAYKETSSRLEFFKHNPQLIRIWERYMHTLHKCVLRLIQASS